MSVYLVRGTKIWRYDFVMKGIRYSVSGFKTMTDARLAEANARRALQNPPAKPQPTAMGFLELLNKRLDHVKAYNTDQHYKDNVYHSTRWAKEWGSLKDLKLHHRFWACDNCGAEHDRDISAAINILNFCTVGATGTKACGEDVSLSILCDVKQTSAKQEAQRL